MIRKAQAQWKGDPNGNGSLTTQSGAIQDLPYSFKLRFENEDGKQGTNPEELIAAAHAGCYSMALTAQLDKAGYKADTINTHAELSFSQSDGGWKTEKIALKLKAIVTDISEDDFDKIAQAAKEGCPVSQLLNCEITLDYTLN